MRELLTEPEIDYPESDGLPMADNTLQWDWMVRIKENLEILFLGMATVFVAGKLFWYPVQGRNDIRVAPDVLVVFGRPRGRRGAYLQWREGGIPPQVVFEVRSPGNRHAELEEKRRFYEYYGVEEYYLYDPDAETMEGWRQVRGKLRPIPTMNGHVSKRLGIRFDLSGPELVIYGPDGAPFLSMAELSERARLAEARERRERRKAKREVKQAHEARERAEQGERLAQERAERLAAKLRSLGLSEE